MTDKIFYNPSYNKAILYESYFILTGIEPKMVFWTLFLIFDKIKLEL